MRVIQVGQGAFGWRWFQEILVKSEHVEVVGIVEHNQELLQRAAEVAGVAQEALFSDLIEAIGKTKPDFILNTTPPHIHSRIIQTCLRYGIPVLCEKPVSDDWEDALSLYQDVQSSGVPVMIAENYRYKPIIRQTKRLLVEGRIGNLTRIEIAFMQRHHIHNYHANLTHPLLVDVSIHHMDMLRYFTGIEGSTVVAQTWSPASSWYPRNSNAQILIEMENGLPVSYRGSLDATRHFTDWNGTWKFHGDQGVISVKGDQIIVEALNSKEDEVIFVTNTEDSRSLVLKEFIASLTEGRQAETDLSDNMRTFSLTFAAIQSAEQGKMIKLHHGLLP